MLDGLHSKHCFRQPDTRCRLHRMFHKGSDCLLVVTAFGRIDDIICLNQNLIVNAVDLRRTMVVPYQIGHPVDLFCRHAGICQELPHQWGTLLLLIFTIGVAVLFAAERAGDKAALRSLACTLHQELKEKGIFVGIVTIMGNVVPETHYAPEKIAEVYWKMYQERKVWEYIYQ